VGGPAAVLAARLGVDAAESAGPPLVATFASPRGPVTLVGV
jgi:hypothetical protein